MNTLLQMARGLAFDKQASSMWRRIALTFTTFVALLTLTIGVSIINSLEASDRRSQDRAFADVEVDSAVVESDAAGLWVLSGLDKFEDRQFIVNHIEPNTLESYVLPPGMTELPAPGVAVVSPALGQLIESDDALAARYPNYEVLEWTGVASADELYAWVRPLDRERFLQSEGLVFVRQFNYQSATPNSFGSTLDTPIPRRQIYLFAIVVGVLPAFLLTLSGIAAHSRKREERIRTLQEVGASDFWIVRLSMLEAVLVTIPVALITLPLLKFALERVDTMPMFGRQVVVGDLDVSWRQLALIMLLVLLVTFSSVATEVLLIRKRSFPVKLWNRVRIVFQIGLFGLAAFLALVLAPQSTVRAMPLFVANLLIIFAIVPGLLVQLVGPIGGTLASSKRLVVQIAGARLQYLTSSSVRPFVGVALVLILWLQGTGMVAHLYDRLDFVDHTQAPGSAEVSARVPFTTLRQTMEERLDNVLVFPAVYMSSEPDLVPLVVFGIDCSEVTSYLKLDSASCSNNEKIESGLFGFPFHHPYIMFDPELAVQAEPAPDSLMVVSQRTMYQMDRDVRTALPVAEFPGLNIATPESFRLKVSPVVPWIEQGATSTVALIGIVVLVGVIDQSISGRGYSRKLLSLGASGSTLLGIEAVIFLTPALVAFGLGLGFGVLELAILDRLISFPWSMIPIGLITAIGLASIFLSAVFVATFNSRVKEEDLSS